MGPGPRRGHAVRPGRRGLRHARVSAGAPRVPPAVAGGALQGADLRGGRLERRGRDRRREPPEAHRVVRVRRRAARVRDGVGLLRRMQVGSLGVVRGRRGRRADRAPADEILGRRAVGTSRREDDAGAAVGAPGGLERRAHGVARVAARPRRRQRVIISAGGAARLPEEGALRAVADGPPLGLPPRLLKRPRGFDARVVRAGERPGARRGRSGRRVETQRSRRGVSREFWRGGAESGGRVPKSREEGGRRACGERRTCDPAAAPLGPARVGGRRVFGGRVGVFEPRGPGPGPRRAHRVARVVSGGARVPQRVGGRLLDQD
mmetsp:Transcript_33637/g.104173  ORF Transcript_33637/g.104173 Transcript_33637/m.104173 type:complete len:320 (-) Transcript_33637:568-1527(-)